jgi:hypothetical protein
MEPENPLPVSQERTIHRNPELEGFSEHPRYLYGIILMSVAEAPLEIPC